MRWRELSDDRSVWKLPGTRTKNRREHVVPMPPLARDVIDDVASPSAELVFTTTGTTPISGWSKAKIKLDALMGSVEPWVIHDLRRTAITGMARAGADLHVIERAVNHVSGTFGGIVSIYQKHKFEDEVRRALEAWANLLARIVEGRPANVVDLRREA
jgi:integrase